VKFNLRNCSSKSFRGDQVPSKDQRRVNIHQSKQREKADADDPCFDGESEFSENEHGGKPLGMDSKSEPHAFSSFPCLWPRRQVLACAARTILFSLNFSCNGG
jgi:hypothetical protein